jgi:FkbM family methyltransferase
VAARNRGLDVALIGAEGDRGHVAFAERGCAENGFRPDQVRIHHGIVGSKAGTALFPRQAEAGISWGLEPIFDATPNQIAEAEAGDRYDVLPVLTLDALSAGNRIDLVHIDIQGGEADFIEGCLSELNRLTAYIVIGTHSRQIEGRIMTMMLAAGWILEVERPAILDFEAGIPFVTIDGVQGWRNPSVFC